jgi:hypothetical protein
MKNAYIMRARDTHHVPHLQRSCTVILISRQRTSDGMLAILKANIERNYWHCLNSARRSTPTSTRVPHAMSSSKDTLEMHMYKSHYRSYYYYYYIIILLILVFSRCCAAADNEYCGSLRCDALWFNSWTWQSELSFWEEQAARGSNKPTTS